MIDELDLEFPDIDAYGEFVPNDDTLYSDVEEYLQLNHPNIDPCDITEADLANLVEDFMKDKPELDYLNVYYIFKDIIGKCNGDGNYDVNEANGLTEALTPEEKVNAWANGTRKENIKACGDDKLDLYKKIAQRELEKYAAVIAQIESEQSNRGTTPVATTPSAPAAPVTTAPAPTVLTATDLLSLSDDEKGDAIRTVLYNDICWTANGYTFNKLNSTIDRLIPGFSREWVWKDDLDPDEADKLNPDTIIVYTYDGDVEEEFDNEGDACEDLVTELLYQLDDGSFSFDKLIKELKRQGLIN